MRSTSAEAEMRFAYARAMYDALGSTDRSKHRIAGANHYLIGADQIDNVKESGETCSAWLTQRGLAPAAALSS